MLKPLLEYLPLVLFVIVTRYYNAIAKYYGWAAGGTHDGLKAATMVLIACALLQAIVYRLKGWKFSSMQKWSICSVVVLGLFSLLFNNPMIIKMKPTVLFGLFAIIGWIVAKWKNINWVERMYREAFAQAETPLPESGHATWSTALIQATAFFMSLSILNAVVAYHATDEQWATFKLFGLGILTLVFFMWQALSLVNRSNTTA
jgi:intracellular septation protein